MNKLILIISIIMLFSSTSFSMNNSELSFDPNERSIQCTNMLAKTYPYTVTALEEQNIKKIRFAYRSIKQYINYSPEGAKELAKNALGWANSLQNVNDDDKETFISDWQQIAAQFSDVDSQ